MYDYLEKLNPQQQRAATYIYGPMLIIAGAGSGKTTVLINRLAYMIDKGIDPSRILLLTFTNAAADNMRTRAEKMIEKSCDGLTACTFHSFCAKMLRIFYKKALLPADFTIITGSDVTGIIKLVKSQLDYNKYKDLLSAAEIESLWGYSRNTGKSVEELLTREDYDPFYISMIQKIIDGYQDYKEKNGYLDYDDLLIKFNDLLDDRDTRDLIEETFPYVMVDEYQDVNYLQESICFKMTQKNRNLCVVGDDYQSIYAFRGADVNGIINFPTKIKDCEVVNILNNYRGTKQLLKIPNDMMDKHARFGFKKIMTCDRSGQDPVFITPLNEKEEAEYIVKTIKEKIAEGVPLKEIAVLTRTSNGSAQIESLLSKNDIPFIKLGGVKFFEQNCIMEILSFFRCISNTSDVIAWFNLLTLLPGIGEKNAQLIIKDIKDPNLLNRPEMIKKPYYDDLKDFLSFINGIDHAQISLPLERIFSIIKERYIKIREKNISLAKVRDEDNRREMTINLMADIENINILEEMAKDYHDVPSFLDGVMLDEKKDKDNKEKLTISTIHSAKGMEWDIVFIRGLSEGLIPRFSETPEEIMEDLRCIYVAFTRAKNEMYLTAPKYSLICGQTVKTPYTRFLKDVITPEYHDSPSKTKMENIYIAVSYRNKDIAKKLGARWDTAKRSWYIPASLDDARRARLLSIYPKASIYRL